MTLKDSIIIQMFGIIEPKIKGMDKDRAIELIVSEFKDTMGKDAKEMAEQVYAYAVQKNKDADDEFHMEDRSKSYFSDMFEV